MTSSSSSWTRPAACSLTTVTLPNTCGPAGGPCSSWPTRSTIPSTLARTSFTSSASARLSPSQRCTGSVPAISSTRWSHCSRRGSQMPPPPRGSRLRWSADPTGGNPRSSTPSRGWGIAALMDRVVQAASAHNRRIPTGPLNRALEAAEQAHHPSADKAGRQIKIYYATQPQVKPPTIVLFANDPQLLTEDYRRYLEGRLRDAFDFQGTPIRLVCRPRERSGAQR